VLFANQKTSDWQLSFKINTSGGDMRGSFLVLLFALLSLTSCGGGGGGGGSGTISITYAPTAVKVAGVVGRDPFGIRFDITATLSSIPSGAVFPVIVASSSVIQTGSTTAVKNPNGSYTASLVTATSLAVGVYTGTLTLHLCKDALCKSEYALSGSTLPFTITIIAVPTFTLSATLLSGGPSTFVAAPGTTYLITEGTNLSLSSNIPVMWFMTNNAASLHNLSSSTTNIAGVATNDAPGFGGAFFFITATSIDAPNESPFTFAFQFN
jgi:hypothetical protein